MAYHQVDDGARFGTWGDPTSRFMYEASLATILPLAALVGRVGDFGGANGLLKAHVPNVRTIDSDASKQPDIVDDILQHRDRYDTAWCRYVMHYLTDKEVIRFVDNVNAPRLVLVQFVNDDLRAKYANSAYETKHFRTGEQMRALLPAGTRELWSCTYEVCAEFYKNRLGLDNATPHAETIKVYEVIKA